MPTSFLTNEQRLYLGIDPISEDWDIVEFTNRMFTGEHVWLAFDGDTIRRLIRLTENMYEEIQLCELTAADRTILLPKTGRGKPKKLNFAATQKMQGRGNYFYAWMGGIDGRRCSVGIANYTTQRTYIHEDFHDTGILKDDVQRWLRKWIDETTDEDLAEINRFKNAQRTHQNYRAGDFFAFRLSRREWGFGRILMDVRKQLKDPHFSTAKNYGLTNLIGHPLIVHLYHKIDTTPHASIEELKTLPALPAQAIFDNRFFYGEYPIIGHLPVSPEEYDPLISVSETIRGLNPKVAYLQYGLIYKETDVEAFEASFPDTLHERYRNDSIGFTLKFPNLRQCIAERSNQKFWDSGNLFDHDLRNPRNADMKRRLFSFFGLDADKSYAENLFFYS